MKKILAAFLILAATANARADEQEFWSLEWMVDHSSAIGIYKVVFAGTRDTPQSAQYGLKLELQQTLKGNARATEQTPGKGPYYSAATYIRGQRKSGVEAGDLFLVFSSETWRGFVSIAPGNPDQVIDANIDVIKDPAAILRLVRDRIAHGPLGKQDKTAVIPESPPDKNFVPLPFDVLRVEDAAGVRIPDDLLARAIARRDLLGIVSGLRSYYYIKHVMPAGGNAAIMSTLIKQKSFFDFEPNLNAAGEAFDPWGTPYRIDASNPKFPWAYSCGPDKKDDGGAPGSDDIVSW